MPKKQLTEKQYKKLLQKIKDAKKAKRKEDRTKMLIKEFLKMLLLVAILVKKNKMMQVVAFLKSNSYHKCKVKIWTPSCLEI